MLTFHMVIVAAMTALVQCQRGSFAGKRPIGIPELLNKTTTTVDPLGNRFGEADSTTVRLPIEANGDRDLVDRISKWPIDNQPFWYLNWKALEEQRKNPQTYPQRPSQFAENPNFNAATTALNTNSGTLNSRFGSNTGTNPNAGTQNSSSETLNSTFGNNPNPGTVNSNFGTNSNAGAINSNVATIPKAGSINPSFGNHSNIEIGNSDSSSEAQSTEDQIIGNRNGGLNANHNIGQRKPVNTGFHGSGFGHYPHNRYGANHYMLFHELQKGTYQFYE